jgi:integrase
MRPKVLTPQQVQAILDACEHLRDRLLFALLLDTGVFSRGQSPCASVVL